MEVRPSDRNDNTYDVHLSPEEADLVHRLGFIPGIGGSVMGIKQIVSHIQGLVDYPDDEPHWDESDYLAIYLQEDEVFVTGEGSWVRCTPAFLAPLGGCPHGARRGVRGGGHEHWVSEGEV